MLKLSQSPAGCLSGAWALTAPSVALLDPPAPCFDSTLGIGLSRSPRNGIVMLPLRAVCFATAAGTFSPLSALLAPNAGIRPSRLAPVIALSASPVTLIGSVIVLRISSRSSRSTFLASCRRRRSVNPVNLSRRKLIVRSFKGAGRACVFHDFDPRLTPANGRVGDRRCERLTRAAVNRKAGSVTHANIKADGGVSEPYRTNNGEPGISPDIQAISEVCTFAGRSHHWSSGTPDGIPTTLSIADSRCLYLFIAPKTALPGKNPN